MDEKALAELIDTAIDMYSDLINKGMDSDEAKKFSSGSTARLWFISRSDLNHD